MTKIQPVLTWRSAICDSDLEATTRHVALTLSTYMGDRGDSAFPGAKRLANDSGLSVKTIRIHLDKLVETGFLSLVAKGGIKGEKRMANHYEARIPTAPEPAAKVTRHAKPPVTQKEVTRHSDGASPVTEIPPNSSIELSMELSTSAAQAPQGKTRAHLLTEKHWSETKPRPVLRGKFPALRGMVETLCEAGYDDDSILRALRNTKAYTLAAIQFSLREANGGAKKNGHQRTLDNLRNMMEVPG